MKVGDLIEFLSVTRPHSLDGQWRLGLLLNIENLKEDKYCNVCDTYRPKLNNKIYFIKYDCCMHCYYDYVIDREGRWLQGWRPNKKEKGEQTCR